MYAVLQIGGPVYGIGATELEACQNALEWLDEKYQGVEDIPDFYPSVTAGEVVVIECTQALADFVEAHGGDARWDINDTEVAYLLGEDEDED